MTKQHTPQDAVASVLADPVLPPGDDERFVGFGIMGLPFANGHYLAMRQFPATSFAPPYVSVWHRDPSCNWTFYATTPGQQSCARYFSSATPKDAVQCDISVGLGGPVVGPHRYPRIAAVDLRTAGDGGHPTDEHGRHPAVRVGMERPEDSAAAQQSGKPDTGRRGHSGLTGRAPNGQCYMMAPKQLWTVADWHAELSGRDLGASGPLLRQARLGDFRMPQRGIGMVGSPHFETFDADRHRSAERAHSFA